MLFRSKFFLFSILFLLIPISDSYAELDVNTNSNVYAPSHDLQVYGKALPEENLILRIFSPDDTIAKFDQLTTDDEGKFSYTLLTWPNASDNFPFGTYTVEVISTTQNGISKKIVELSLKNKIHVITPNKALISKHGDYLSNLAEKHKVNLEFEAAVAGGIPIIRTIKEGLATNKISKVYGILNGTCNYILTQMEKTKDSFSNVLKEAQKLGYAEPINPRLDLNGSDALEIGRAHV